MMTPPSPIVLLAVLLTLTSACDPLPGEYGLGPSQGFQYTMHAAKVVLIGRTLAQTNDSYDVTFRVDCVVKTTEKTGDIEDTVTIRGDYYFNSCTTTYLEMGMDYVIALHDRDDANITYLYNNNVRKFGVFEPDIASTAAYKNASVNITDLNGLCEMGDYKGPNGEAPGESCPTKEDSEEDCQKPEYKVKDVVSTTPFDLTDGGVGSSASSLCVFLMTMICAAV